MRMAGGRSRVHDIELVVDAMGMCSHVHAIVLFSENGDFRVLLETVQRGGVRVAAIFTILTQPAMVADELRP